MCRSSNLSIVNSSSGAIIPGSLEAAPGVSVNVIFAHGIIPLYSIGRPRVHSLVDINLLVYCHGSLIHALPFSPLLPPPPQWTMSRAHPALPLVVLSLFFLCADAVTVWLAGDSTSASRVGSLYVGWGSELQDYLTIAVQNMAVAGKTLRSFTKDGHCTCRSLPGYPYRPDLNRFFTFV